MKHITRIAWLAFSGITFTLAALILHSTGLPQQRDFTGFFVEDYGYVAPEIDALAPPFTLPRLDGTPFSLSDHFGTPIILNFWATWCEPCKVEMPQLMEVANLYPDVTILAINTGESQTTIRRWLTENAITLQVLQDTHLDVATRYRLRGQPMTYIIDADGRIDRIFFGAVSASTLIAHLESVLTPTRQ